MFSLFMKKIATDTSSEEISRIRLILDKNQIQYTVDTARSRGIVGAGMDASSYARANLPMYNQGVQPTFIYTVYVRRKDYALAHKLLYGA